MADVARHVAIDFHLLMPPTVSCSRNSIIFRLKFNGMKVSYLLLIPVLFAMTACGGGGGESDSSADSTQVSELPRSLQAGVMEVDLSDHFINATVLIPDSSRGLASIQTNDFGEVRIVVGDVYNLVIVENLDATMDSKLQALNEDLMYQHEVIEQGDDYVLYKSSIEGSHVDPVFHFFAFKTIDGIEYEFHDYNEEGGYAESVARLMLESVNHLRVNNSAT